MATMVIMPRQGQSVESCIIAKWHKKKGDKVHIGDILFSYETDKAAFDEESKAEGTLLEIFYNEGDDVPVLTNVCAIGEEGENIGQGAGMPVQKESAAVMPASDVQPEIKAEKTPEASGDTPAGVTANEGDLKISPRARILAEKSGVNIHLAAGTGPEGRIIEKDIAALIGNSPAATVSARGEYVAGKGAGIAGTGLGGRITTGDLTAEPAQKKSSPAAVIPGSVLDAAIGAVKAAPVTGLDYEEVKLSNIRKVIAKAMHQSLSSTAQLTLNASFDATDMLAFRKKLKESADRIGLGNITINDIILYTVSRTLSSHKQLNAHFMDDTMRIYHHVHLGIAVDTERGLMVPTLFDADLKSLDEISKEAKKLAEDCQKGTINPDLLKGGTFTVTNLGTLGIESFTPVLNPPQTGILGVNTIVQRVREEAGAYIHYPAMGLSLTFDHRALDGAPAARFLKDLKTNLENFSVLLAK